MKELTTNGLKLFQDEDGYWLAFWENALVSLETVTEGRPPIVRAQIEAWAKAQSGKSAES